MSDELKEGMSTLKKTILGVVTTAVTGAGVYLTTNINKIFGIEDETEAKVEQLIEAQQQTQAAQQAAQPAPIILNIDNSSTNNANSNSGGGQTIIRETVREVPAQAAVPVEEKVETPIERMKRLKAEKDKKDGQ